MSRVSFFIDGFNLYHALMANPKYYRFRWLNLRRFAELFIQKTDTINKIYFFTAYASWNVDKMKRHQNYIEALSIYNVETIFGKFKRKDRHCPLCKKDFHTYEEKQTDVNIAIRLFQEAMNNTYDTAVIISGDSDLIPSIRSVKISFPVKKVGVIIPIGRQSEDLKAEANFHMKMKEKHLLSSLLPDPVEKDGKKIYCPPSWK